MTAEIALINRSAVTLATDSAVTLTVRGAEKIYNSADKLFELCDHDPIGIMVYNNLEYMGISLEVAIKQFRRKGGAFSSVEQAAKAFFDYLSTDLLPDEALQKKHARAILSPVFADLKSAFVRAVTRALEETKNPRKVNPRTVFASILRGKITELEGYSPAPCFADTTEDTLTSQYSESLDDTIKDVFNDFVLQDDVNLQLRRIGTLVLHRQVTSDLFTGLVFAGFGSEETFPALIAYKMDGVVLGKLRFHETERITTKRDEPVGKILPFAQREMVDRYLYGIDPQFELAIEQYLGAIVKETGKQIAEAAQRRRSKANKEKLEKSIREATDVAVRTWKDKMVPIYKERFMREVQDMLLLMPKQELALLAQELINLTSVKRKFSSGRESVGGPIDVAVISRTDGFVWVRRKHYFEQNLNPRYFFRKFGSARQEIKS